MGSGISSATAAKSAIDRSRQPTAKVVAADGSLTEHAAPISASDALGGGAAEFFVCDSNRLRFDAAVPALGAADLLQPGQLYFVLPLALRGCALSGLDMAALAVKAAAALDAAASDKKKGWRVVPVENALVQHRRNDYHCNDDDDDDDDDDDYCFYSTVTVSASNSASDKYGPKKKSFGTRSATSRRLRRMLSTILEDAE